jgi:hypothetical protein
MSTLKVSEILDTAGGNTVTINGATPTTYNTMGRNRIINGDMRIAQRGTSGTLTAGTPSGFKCVDRWSQDWSLNGTVTVEQSSDAPVGFMYSLKSTIVTTSTDSMAGTEYFAYRQPIEGFNLNDLAYGTAGAKQITVSFWVKASTPATYSAGFRASLSTGTAGNHQTYSINAADTWEYKTLVFNGSTAGTLSNADTNSAGMELFLSFANGANVADPSDDGNWTTGNYIGLNSNDGTIGNFGALAAGQYIAITGVQLEVGSVATEFERRPYGTELALCQRYLPSYIYASSGGATEPVGYARGGSVSSIASAQIAFPVTARVPPTGVTVTGSFAVSGLSFSTVAFGYANTQLGGLSLSGGSGMTVYYMYEFQCSTAGSKILFTGCEL